MFQKNNSKFSNRIFTKNIKKIKINHFTNIYIKRSDFIIRNEFIILLILIILQISVIQSKIIKFTNLNYLEDQVIFIKLNKNGTQRIFDYAFPHRNCTILVNNNQKNLEDDINLSNINKGDNITLIWKYLLKDCQFMFTDVDLEYIEFKNFDTSKVTSMDHMFFGCRNLVSLDLSSFNTSSVTNMMDLFNKCTQLSYLNISNFKTLSVNNMNYMFCDCISLKSITLNNFNTSSLISMEGMFYNCSQLRSINLSNFNTNKVTNMAKLFFGCNSLKSLDLITFNTSQVNNTENMFNGCNSLTSLNLFSFNTMNVGSYNYMFDGCNSSLIYCIKNNYLNENIKSQLTNFINNCTDICNNLHLKIINETNQCIENCSDDEIYKIEYNNKCYQNYPEETYHFSTQEYILDKDLDNTLNITNYYQIEYYKTFIEEKDIECDIEYYYKNAITDECVKECKGFDFFNNICTIRIDDNNAKDNLIKTIGDDIENRLMDSLIINLTNGNGDDLQIIDKNISYQITNTKNQKNNENKNKSAVILGECEDILKDKYKIDEDKSLLIFKIDYYKEDSLIPIIGYEVFHPENKSRLDLNYCKENLIDFDIPVTIDENNVFKYDPNNEFYIDECIPYTTENGTDILINDRQDEYNNNNLSICENNCTLQKYDSDSKKSKCQCGIKIKQIIISEVFNQTDILSNNFNKNNGSSNLVSMKCVYTLFSKDGLYKNIGSYLLIFLILSFIITIILFHKTGYHFLEEDINEIISQKSNGDKDNNKKNKENINIKETNIKNNPIKNKDKNKSKELKIIKSKKNKKPNRTTNIDNSTNKFSTNIMLQKNLNININNNINSKKNKKEKIKEKALNKKTKLYNINNLTDYEINTFSYNEAIKSDKRTFCDYYASLIRTKHPIIFSFLILKADYNSLIIKIDLFILLIAFNYFSNALFFNKAIIHKIYKDQGAYNFKYSLPFILLAFLISHILITVVKYFSLSERNICEIKKEKNLKRANNKADNVKSFLIKKYLCFYILGVAFLLFLWYYLSSFCAVYQNSQKFLIINTAISIVISFIYPIFINFIPGVLRILALTNSNKECIYKASKIIQLF